MYSSPDYDNLLVLLKQSRFFCPYKQIVVFYLILFAHFSLGRADSHKLNGPSFNGLGDGCSVKVDVFVIGRLFLERIEKGRVFYVAPRVEESKVNLFIGGHSVSKWPLNPTVVIFLNGRKVTMEDKLIRSRILFHCWEDSSL